MFSGSRSFAVISNNREKPPLKPEKGLCLFFAKNIPRIKRNIDKYFLGERNKKQAAHEKHFPPLPITSKIIRLQRAHGVVKRQHFSRYQAKFVSFFKNIQSNAMEAEIRVPETEDSSVSPNAFDVSIHQLTNPLYLATTAKATTSLVLQ